MALMATPELESPSHTGVKDECEDRFLRFYQKGGDGEVDTNPIAMLSKGEVLQLGRALGLPRSVLDAIPSPDLLGIGERHTDEDELKAMTAVEWTYSRIDVETGEYTRVGTIERMSRLLDETLPGSETSVERVLFGPRDPIDDEKTWNRLLDVARPFFAGRDAAAVRGLLVSARQVERATHRELNPGIPTLGDRKAHGHRRFDHQPDPRSGSGLKGPGPAMRYTYEHPRPSLAVDMAIFSVDAMK